MSRSPESFLSRLFGGTGRRLPRRAATLAAMVGVVLALLSVVAPGAQATPSASARVSTAGCDQVDCTVISKAPTTTERTRPAISGFFNVMQLNLCNSGKADCYQDGASLAEARNRIDDRIPDVVTLNEVCAEDVDSLFARYSSWWSFDNTFAAFAPAIQLDTGDPVTCTHGDPATGGNRYGIALMWHVPPSEFVFTDLFAGIYGIQAANTNEGRVFLCAFSGISYLACVTHLAASNETAAMIQCQTLMSAVIPDIETTEGFHLPTVVGGDLNLKFAPIFGLNVQDCVPDGFFRKGDGGVQHIMASTDIGFRATHVDDMHGATDHPALTVDLTMP